LLKKYLIIKLKKKGEEWKKKWGQLKKKTDRVGGQLKEKKGEASLYINMNSEILLYYFTHYAASRIKN
jgi:hypothetical protein